MVRSFSHALIASLFFVICSTSADERHLRRHQGYCCDVCVEGQVCHVADRPADFGYVHQRLGLQGAVSLGSSGRCSLLPRSVAALPISICPQAMSNARPSSAVDLVRQSNVAAEHVRISSRC